MSAAVGIVFRKEVLENIRDRRVIFSAFFFGVLLAPVIFALSTTMTSKRIVQTQDEPLKLSVSGQDRAPNLIEFLEDGERAISAANNPKKGGSVWNCMA